MPKTFAAIAAVSFMLASTGAFAQAAKVADTPAGKTYVDSKGMTLYTFDKDSAGKSACNGPCATNWPPLMAAADAKASGDWTVVAKADARLFAAAGRALPPTTEKHHAAGKSATATTRQRPAAI